MGRYSVPRPAKTERNWQVYRARRVEGLTFTRLVERFGVNRKRIGDILAWCERQPGAELHEHARRAEQGTLL